MQTIYFVWNNINCNYSLRGYDKPVTLSHVCVDYNNIIYLSLQLEQQTDHAHNCKYYFTE